MEGVVGEGKEVRRRVWCVCVGWFVFLVSFRFVCCRRFPFESKRQQVYCRSAPHSVLAVRLRRPDSRPVPHLPFFRSAAFCLPSGSPVLPLRSAASFAGGEYPLPLLLSPRLTNPIQFREEKRWPGSPSIERAQFGGCGGKLGFWLHLVRI